MLEDDLQDKNMNPSCREFQANLDAYLEESVPAHATSCVACGALFADLASIRSTARTLELESPPPRVWSNIRATLEMEGIFRARESFWKRWVGSFRLAPRAVPIGALALLIILAVFLISPADLYHRLGTHSSPAPAAAASQVPANLTAVEANLARTVQAMEISYKAREAYLDPGAQQTYARGLSSLNNSIEECLASVREQPQNSLAHRYLVEAYSEKADVLASALEYDGR